MMADRSAAADKQPHPIYSDRWADGTVRARFPGPALTHGQHAYQHRGLPEDLRLSIEDSRRGVIADQGGADALTTLQAGYIARLCDVDVAIRLLQNDLIQRGMFTGRGRVR